VIPSPKEIKAQALKEAIIWLDDMRITNMSITSEF